MNLEILDIKIKDLPKDLIIQMPSDSTDVDIEKMIESLKAQLIYNSSFDEDEKELSLKINVLGRTDNTVRLHIDK